MAQGRFAHGALEEKHLVGQVQRVGVEEVDLHLSRTHFVDQRVHVELHLFAVIVDLFEQRIELVDRVDAVGLARSFGAATAANRGLEQGIGVGVASGQVELQLGRDHGVPTFGIVQVTNAAQHAAWCKGHQLARMIKAIVDHLCRWVGGPRHDARCAGVWAQLHVFVGRVNDVVVRAVLGEFARHAHGHNRLGQPHTTVFGELTAGQDLAPRHTRQVGHEAFHLGHPVLVEPKFQIIEGCHGGGCHVPSPVSLID